MSVERNGTADFKLLDEEASRRLDVAQLESNADPFAGVLFEMTVKERLHQLIEELPEQELSDAELILQALRAHPDDRLARKLLLAPIDDEPETDEERLAAQEGRDALARGDVVRDEDLDRELGR